MARIVGDGRDDVLVGTDAADLIEGLGGDDRLVGRGGDDLLRGGSGRDALLGGRGDDTLDGGTGNDLVRPGPGVHVILGGPGTDTLSYADLRGAGVFVCSATDESCLSPDEVSGIEVLIGTERGDLLDGSDGPPIVLRGLGGDDGLVGSFGDDRVFGGPGDDVITERAGDDLLRGGGGDDTIVGDTGRGRLFGDAGDDFLAGGIDDDLLTGGAGRDVFEYDALLFSEPGGQDLALDFRRGSDRVDLRFSLSFPPQETLGTFRDFDSNGDGRLDYRDALVEVEEVAHGGATRRSTVIDVGTFTEEFFGDIPGVNTLTVFGVTGLAAADFVNEPLMA